MRQLTCQFYDMYTHNLLVYYSFRFIYSWRPQRSDLASNSIRKSMMLKHWFMNDLGGYSPIAVKISACVLRLLG
jgi:hypothetical protein